MKINVTTQIEVPDDATHYSGSLEEGVYDIFKEDQLVPRDAMGWWIWFPTIKRWGVYSEEKPFFIKELPQEPPVLQLDLQFILQQAINTGAQDALNDVQFRGPVLRLIRIVEQATIHRAAAMLPNCWVPINLVPPPKDGKEFDVWFWVPGTGEGCRFEDLRWSDEKQYFEHFIFDEWEKFELTTETHWMRVTGPEKPN